MIQNNYFSENADIVQHFNNLISWQDVIECCEQNFRDHKEYSKTKDELLAYAPANAEEAIENYHACLDSTGDIAGNFVAPRAAKIDKEGLQFNNGKVTFPQALIECIDKLKEAGLHAYALKRRHGGLHLPFVLQAMLVEVIFRADSSFGLSACTLNFGATIETCADKETAKEWVSQMGAGEMWGAMALTEPNYGSDLPHIQTRAEKDENGQWRINGTKRFITQGCGFADKPSAILTLARTGNPGSSARGLSFFIVKSTDVEIAGIEKKLGIHASPTCEVVYENTPAVLMGKEGLGLIKYAMGMMNEARLAVAAQSLGIAQAAYSEAGKYASERKQFGVLIREIPAVSKMLKRMQREVAAMRCLLYETSTAVDFYAWSKHSAEKEDKDILELPKGKEARKWEKLANFLTPLTKYYISETCKSIADDAIQVHGGSGYTEEYDVARIYRDARITTVYEGTSQLQIIAAVAGINAGMSATGFLRNYINEQMSSFPCSSSLKELYNSFDELCSNYRQIKDSKEREGVAWEAVQSAARFVNGILLERCLANPKLSASEKEQRHKLTEQYHLDSKAILAANAIQINERL